MQAAAGFDDRTIHFHVFADFEDRRRGSDEGADVAEEQRAREIQEGRPSFGEPFEAQRQQRMGQHARRGGVARVGAGGVTFRGAVEQLIPEHLARAAEDWLAGDVERVGGFDLGLHEYGGSRRTRSAPSSRPIGSPAKNLSRWQPAACSERLAREGTLRPANCRLLTP